MSDSKHPLRAWLLMLSTANAIKKSSDAKFRDEFGVSIARFDVLAALDRAGADGLRAGVLSQQLMVTEGNTTQVTAPLIRNGCVKRTPSRDDGRVAILKITKKGQRLFDNMARAHREWIRQAFCDLSPKQLEQLLTLLQKIDLPKHAAHIGKDAA